MRRIFNTLLALCMVLSLSACSLGVAEPFSPAPVLQSLADNACFSEELEVLDATVAFSLYRMGDYGLHFEDMTDSGILRSSGATCEEAAVLVFSTKEHAQTALGALEDYLDRQIETNLSYRPDEIPKLESALVIQQENTVLLVVAADADAAREALDL